jgi:tRNA(fMet)-specific endonuclease VapC
MSLHVFDTDTVSLYQRGHLLLSQRIAAHPLTDLAITVITIEEQLSGWYSLLRRTTKRDQLALVYQSLADSVPFLARFPILSFPEPAILRFEQLVAMKLNLGRMDLRIAAITLENGGILVTRNTRDFQRVPGLVVQDWTI